MDLCKTLYEMSGKVPSYDFFLELTRPENANKLDKLKLHVNGVFKRKFWEDLELSKNRFPNLRKISIKNIKFNLYNLKYFQRTSVESFNFRNTAINQLKYIEFLLRENKRVMISGDTALMAIAHAKQTKDYEFLTLAIQTGSWGRKNPERLSRELLDLSAGIGHMEAMQKWAEKVTFPSNTPEVIRNAITIIKHPMVTMVTEDSEMLVVYAEIVRNPIYKRILTAEFLEKESGCIKIPMSEECLVVMTAFELKGQLVPGMDLDVLIELANFAEMYFWDTLKVSLEKYKVSCKKIWVEETQNPMDMFESAISDLVPLFPEFIRPSIIRQMICHLEIPDIYVCEEGCKVQFCEALGPMLNKLHHVHLLLDLSYIDYLKENGPYTTVVSVKVVSNGLMDLIEGVSALFSFEDCEDLTDEQMQQLLIRIFPSCVEFNL